MPKRKIYLDYLRVISMLSVVLIHIFTTARTDFSNYTRFEYFISFLIPQILHFSVPIFLMITGSLFLNPKKQITLKEYYTKYICRYLIILGTFGLAFSIIENLFTDNLSINVIFKSIANVLVGKTWNHMWYVYTLIGIFTLMPFLKIICDYISQDKKMINYFLIIGLIACFIKPTIKEIFNISIPPIPLPLFSNYIYYLFMGYFIDSGKVSLSNIQGICLIIINVAILIGVNIIGLFYEIKNIDGLGEYSSIFILFESIGIFIVLKNLENKLKENRFIKWNANLSFGVYLIHMFWINVLYKFIKFNIYGNFFLLNSVIVFIGVLITSLITSIILKKIPIIKKVI